ncbi:MAG: M1 family metallopeptidase [Polyangiaceae bacterium]|nr:M1 family metallopeptidase [Polyangiaceae bacterium]MCE7889443.1 M1 family peptidase [Sorangiineae bacterium PRO1]MCL4751324.1 M1 family metallopeptidase [Myxococcales bacterium]
MKRALPVLVALALSACASPSPNARWRPDPPPAKGTAVSAPAPRDDGRLPAGVRPTRYNLELTVDPRDKSFFGRVRIGVEVATPTRVIVLHAKGPKILTAAVSSETQKLWAKASTRRAAHGKEEPEELVLELERELPAGKAEIDLQYEAPFGPSLGGLYRVEEGGQSYAFTQFEPNDARRAFPCFDEPGFKVPYQLSLTVPEGFTAVANTPELRRRENRQSGLVSYEFAPSPPLPSYLVAFAIGAFEIREGARDPVPIRLVTLPGKSRLGQLALDVAREELGVLADYFGVAYPYAKLDLVAVPEFGAGAMENAGLVTFREELLLLDEARASLDARRGLYGIMAHELAHQWFGNLVTMKWWDDLWLNEGFATWMGAKVVERVKPAFGVDLERVSDKQWVMGVDMLASARRIRQPVRGSSEALEAFDGITYVKGASTLSMIESYVGEAAFRQGVRDYLGTHRFGNAEARDLFLALGKTSGKDVASVMSSFVDQSGVPLVDVSFGCEGKKLAITLSQREYRPLGSMAPSAAKSWLVPVCLGLPNERVCTLLGKEPARVEREVRSCPAAVHPNADERGYYRYGLPKAALLALAKQPTLSLREKVGLLGNSWALVRSGDLELATYFELLPHLLSGQSHVLWDQLTDSLREVSRALESDSTRSAFQARVRLLAGKEGKRLGFRPTAGEAEGTKLARNLVLSLLGDLGAEPWVLGEADKLAGAWLDQPGAVDPDVARVALPLAARRGDEKLFIRLFERMKQASTPEERLLALSGLSAFDDLVLVERLLGYALDGSIKVSDLRYVFPPLFQRRATAKPTYLWLTRHFDALKSRLPSFAIGRFPWVAAALCDESAVAEAEAFFRPRLERIEGADKHLAQAAEAGKLCAALRAGRSRAFEELFGGKP